MNSVADMGCHYGRATPSLHDALYRQFKEATGRRSTYPLPIPVQTNPATSEQQDVSDMVRKVGVDNCLFETDFPHPTSLFPIDNLEARLSSLTQEERSKVLSLNASKLYNIPV